MELMRNLLSALRGKIELKLLSAWLIVAGGLWGFIELMEIARDASPHDFDTAILLAFRSAGDPATPIGPAWMEGVVRDITGLGGTAVLTFITVASVLYLLVAHKPRTALFLCAAIAGGQVLSSLLKLGVERPRPDLVSHLVDVHTLSFPSGHAMLSAVTYLTLGSLLARIMPDRASRVYVIGIAVLLTFLVGMSRIYLGVHWPSDVLAGWCAGAAWAMLCWLIARRVLNRNENGNIDA
jgi:undecaprenyl-diphosphatase